MHTLLLMRRSSYQLYAANQLHRRGQLDHVIVETGTPLPGLGSLASSGRWRAVASRIADDIRSAPAKLHWKIAYAVLKRRLYGETDIQDRRVLESGYQALPPDLPCSEVEDINAPEVVDIVKALRPGLVYVFGTRLIRSAVFATFECPVVNLHWGWSPRFRGEGIVSALAEEGPDGLGVTVHLLSAEPDGGRILFRDRPSVDACDNFYSIGLKLTKLGTERLSECYEIVAAQGRLIGVEQNLADGRLYSSKFFRRHPDYYYKAWRRLRSAR